jgi:hypothetical protein
MSLRRLMMLGALFTSSLVGGCDGPTDARVYNGPVRVHVVSPELRLSNTTGEPIYFKVIEQQTATLIDWMPCMDPVACPGVAAGETRRVPYSQIAGYEPGRKEAIVYWWHLEAKLGGGYAMKQLTSVLVRL